MEWQAGLMDEVFALVVSRGAVSNMQARAATQSSAKCTWRNGCSMRQELPTAVIPHAARRSSRLLPRAIAIGRQRHTLKESKFTFYAAELNRRLKRIIASVPWREPARKQRERTAANRAHPIVFVTSQDVLNASLNYSLALI